MGRTAVPETPALALGLMLAPRDARVLPGWLAANAAPFAALVVLYDGPVVPGTVQDMIHGLAPQPRGSVLLDARPLARDFAAQRNRLARMSPCQWMLMLDADEYMDPDALALLGPALGEFLAQRPGVRVVGFPRTNLLDGVPRHEEDFQFRLVRRDEPWVNTHPAVGASPGCHELPASCLEEVEDKDKAVAVFEAVRIIHPKSGERQAAQDALYESY